MDQLLRQRQTMEANLRAAIANDEFILHFQPLLVPNTNEVCSFEALLRWEHPERGLVPPLDFIPLAEETGLIRQIGDWVLLEACKEACNWPDHIRVAVNVSAIQFRGGTLPKSVAAAIEQSGIAGERLEIEITESVLLGESLDALDQLHALRSQGVRIALDDFGTGYSSLSYLRQFRFDKLKMDRSFVQNLNQADAMAIVSTIANLGKCLGMATTAEGIETEQQMRCVMEHGFTEVQGYLYGRPIPPAEILATHFDKTALTISR